MYRIKNPKNTVLRSFYDNYAPSVMEKMKFLLDGYPTENDSFGTSKKIHYNLKLDKNSVARAFIEEYCKEESLWKLLCGGWDELLDIVKWVEIQIPNLEWQNPMTKEGYEKGLYKTIGSEADGTVNIDHFHDIMEWIFVYNIYGTKGHPGVFDKTQFIIDRDLGICPYCGRNMIDVVQNEDSVSKPEIDHFLPKGKYPFLAVSLHNLIPCCHDCNCLQSKGEFDPLEHTNYQEAILNPYHFDDRVVSFSYSYNEEGDMNEKNFEVQTIVESDLLEEGYNKRLKIRGHYANERKETKLLYRKVTKASKPMKKFLRNLGVANWFLDDLEESTLGYRLNEEEPDRIRLYKFKKELFLQMKREFKL